MRPKPACVPRPFTAVDDEHDAHADHQRLKHRLTRALHQALEAEERCEQAHQQASHRYRSVAEVLIELRHAFPGVDGETCDLRGRSPSYRRAVREAYGAIGAEATKPIPKRLTVGVSYWVRKLLIERYGERRLAEEFGVVAGRSRPAPRAGSLHAIESLPDDRTQCLSQVVGLLNTLVADPALEPTEELVRAAQRAVALLLDRLAAGRPRHPADGLWTRRRQPRRSGLSMSTIWSPLRTVARQEFRLLKVDPFPVMLLFVMPLALIPFFTAGLVGGAVASVPGLLAMFGYLGMAVVATVYMRDHGWRTWDRLRAAGVPPAAIVIGKALPLLTLFVVQQVVLLAIGWSVLGLPVKGSVPVLGMMLALTALTQVSLGLVITTHARNIHHANIAIQGGGLMATGLGGAIAPVAALPVVLQHLAPLSPVYWTLKGVRGVTSLSWGLTEALQPMLVLAGISATALAFTIVRYRHDEVKMFYA